MIAKELNIPIIALSQLSRKLEERQDKTPILSDLRESGSIEQDADIVMFIHRPEYYLNKPLEKRENESEDNFQTRIGEHAQAQEEVRNVANVIVAKHRHGPTSVTSLHFSSEFTKFSDLDKHH